MRKVAVVVLLGLIGVFGVAAMAFADHGNDGKRSFFTQLDGWAEVPSQVTTGNGSFRLRIVSPVLWEFTLRYQQLEGPVTQAHIHVGSHHENGGVSAWLCGPGADTEKTCPPAANGELTSTITPADVTGPPGQGVEPGNMADLLRAIRAGETYANVHTDPRATGGEIRGQLADRHNHGGNDNDD
jgi:CHRD domain